MDPKLRLAASLWAEVLTPDPGHNPVVARKADADALHCPTQWRQAQGAILLAPP